MAFEDTMNIVLPNVNGNTAHVTGNYGETRAGKPPHGGVDFNYVGGQNGINLTHPGLNSPISGTVVEPLGGRYGIVTIRDADGNLHQILHTDSRSVTVGQKINAGDPIGTMGNTGPYSKPIAQHVHYQIKDPQGKVINPQKWWNSKGDSFKAKPTVRWGIFDSDGNGVPDIVDKLNTKYTSAKQTVSPIILDLDGDGVETTKVDYGVYFDHDANGFAESTGWVGADDGLLVRDLDGNGTIDSGRELFGSETLLANGTKAKNGFDALVELDSNHDGEIDIYDAAFSTLRVWKDIDGDGYSTPEELLTLEQAGILSINLSYTNSSSIDANGNFHKEIGSFTSIDGEVHATEDVWFDVNNTNTIAVEWVETSEIIDALPDIQGFGKVYDLHQAMARDSSGGLQSLVEQFVEATDVSSRLNLTTSIIYKWTGAEGYAPNSRGYMGDARQLYVIEAFLGDEYIQGFGTYAGTANAGPNAANVLADIYGNIYEMLYAQLLSQTELEPLYNEILYHWDDSSQQFKGDLTQVVIDLTAAIQLDRVNGLILLSDFSRSLKGMDILANFDTSAFQTALATLGTDVSAIIN